MTRARAVTLAETILATFLLVAGMLLVINLLHASLRYQTRSLEQALAAQYARLTLERVRAWAWQQTGGVSNFEGNWATYNGVVLTDPAFPGFTARVDVNPSGRNLYSPNSSLEQTYAPSPRLLNRAVVPVRVRVDGPGADPVLLMTYVGQPPLSLQPLTVSALTPLAPLAQDAQVTLQVAAQDTAGNPVPGLAFRWSLEPAGLNPGLGTLVTDTNGDDIPDTPRDGSQVVFAHRYLRSDGVTWAHKAGQCRVVAHTRQHGQDVSGEIVLDLQTGPLP